MADRLTLSFPPLVLASTSRARQALLRAAGLTYEVRASPFQEEDISLSGREPKEAALLRAVGKAEAVLRPGADEIVLGADQVLDLAGEALGKPSDEEAARQMLQKLSGREHYLRTGVALLWRAQGREARYVESTRLKVRALHPEEIEAYLATREWEGCAGGYRVEGRGVCLFEEISGDYFNILGLPLLWVLSTLRVWGLPLFR